MSEGRDKLLAVLREPPAGDAERSHCRAQAALTEWLREFDPEVAAAWETAQDVQDWGYV